jgi:SOS-response transcriptional repressor LexA
MNPSPVAQRLHEFGQKKYGSDHGWQRLFADAIGITPQSLNQYLKGTVSVGVRLQGKLRAIGCDVEWLMTGKKVDEQEPGPFDVGAVPLIGKIVATPAGKEYFEDFPAGLTIPWAKGNYFALVIENDSLINAPDADHSTELYPGDICIFLVGRQPKTGDIVAVQLKQSNARMVKILKHRSADEIELASANKFRNYPSTIIQKDEVATFGVFAGKVKLSRGEMKKRGIE